MRWRVNKLRITDFGVHLVEESTMADTHAEAMQMAREYLEGSSGDVAVNIVKAQDAPKQGERDG